MRSQNSIIKGIEKVKRRPYNQRAHPLKLTDRLDIWKPIFTSLLFFFVFLISSVTVNSQTIAIIDPVKNDESKGLSASLSKILSKQSKVIDSSLANVVFQTKDFENPFNLSVEESKNLAAGIGSNYLILIRADNQRRSSFSRNEYYESSLVLYLISSRTGKLVSWIFKKFEEDSPKKSKRLLEESLNALVVSVFSKIQEYENSLLSKPFIVEGDYFGDVMLPLPYKRIKPKYTMLAALYDIEATVDIEIEVNEKGEISEAEIVRWAGYGLDESVIETVKAMKWRPGERDGKAFPMKILLRYNFKNIETEE